MYSAITTLFSRTTRAAAAICLATWLVGSQAALADYADVTQVGNTLHIIGDGFANTISIVGAKDTPGTVAVYIHPDPWIYEGVEHINVDLAGGDNTLNMARIEIVGSVTVAAGNGDNLVQLGGWKDYGTSFISGDVSITTAEGDDDVKVEDTWVGGSVTIQTGGGRDDVRIGAPSLFTTLGNIETIGNTILGDLTLFTGAAGDIVWIMRSGVLGHTLIDTAGGQDDVYLGYDPQVPRVRDDGAIRTAVGTTNMFLGLAILTGDGGDNVYLRDNEIYMETIIETGGDDDNLSLDSANLFYGELDAHGGSGQDFLFDDPANYYESSPSFHSFELP